jgi:integrase
MTLQWREETKRWRVRFKRTGPDGKQEDIRITLDKDTSERRAKKIEQAVLAAVKYHDYRYLDPVSRRICIQLFKNKGWTLPPALINSVGNTGSAQELTLHEAIQYCLDDPELRDLADPTRPQQAFVHIQAYWGPDYPMSQIKVRSIKEYMAKRKAAGAAGATINRERSSLSKLFKILMEADMVDRNPVRETLPADEREGQRDIYISYNDFNKILDMSTSWTRGILQTLYFTGMRRGETLNLTWDKVDLENRIITLSYSETKERRGKRVPIHKLLVPILEEIRTTQRNHERVFLNEDGDPPHEDSLTRAWRKAVKTVGIDPRPTVHDLRHCWKTNAMRSGVHPAIADAILGHGDKKKSLESLYLTISDQDLLDAIDRMKFNGEESENGGLFGNQ